MTQADHLSIACPQPNTLVQRKLKIGQTDSLGRLTYRVARQGDMSIELLLTFLSIKI